MIAVNEIKEKLNYLRRTDKKRIVFGSEGHNYILEPVAELSLVLSFEKALGIKLPEDYREFILTVGNGGAGMGYGFCGLHDNDLNYIQDYKQPFRIENFYDGDEFIMEDGKPIQGLDYEEDVKTGCKFLYTSGCAIETLLIINNDKYHGQLITFGYCPIMIGGSFIKEYMRWLNSAVQKVEGSYQKGIRYYFGFIKK